MNIFFSYGRRLLKKKKTKPKGIQQLHAVHLISYQSFIKYEFNLNACIILSYFHLLYLDHKNRPAASICVYQHPLPHRHLLGGELLLEEQCFRKTFLSSELSSALRSWEMEDHFNLPAAFSIRERTSEKGGEQGGKKSAFFSLSCRASPSQLATESRWRDNRDILLCVVALCQHYTLSAALGVGSYFLRCQWAATLVVKACF